MLAGGLQQHIANPDTVARCGILWTFLEYDRVLSNFIGYGRIFWNMIEYCTIL